MLLAALSATGVRTVDLGHAMDSHEELERVLGKALHTENVDVIVSTGGVSMGARDLLKGACAICVPQSVDWLVRSSIRIRGVGLPMWWKWMVARLVGHRHAAYLATSLLSRGLPNRNFVGRGKNSFRAAAHEARQTHNVRNRGRAA